MNFNDCDTIDLSDGVFGLLLSIKMTLKLFFNRILRNASKNPKH